mgnify:CR=1 FL=1|jgi:hypothetical protein
MGYTVIDGIDFFGTPRLDLPFDEGDGPFVSEPARRGVNYDIPAKADSTLVEQEESDQAELVEAGRRLVSAGTVYVSDIIPARSFRRVQHDVNIPIKIETAISSSLEHAIVIRFQGAAGAVLAEKINNADGGIPGANLPEVLHEMLAIANRAADNESSTADGRVDFRAPLPPSMSFYFIRYRQPALEFPMMQPGMTYSPASARGLGQENQIHEFRFNVDGREQFELRYPMGRRIPVVFDIINHGNRAISADLYVEVLIRS